MQFPCNNCDSLHEPHFSCFYYFMCDEYLKWAKENHQVFKEERHGTVTVGATDKPA